MYVCTCMRFILLPLLPWAHLLLAPVIGTSHWILLCVLLNVSPEESLFCSSEPSALLLRPFSSDHLIHSPTLTNHEGQAELPCLHWSFYSILECLLSNRHLTISTILSTLKCNFWSYYYSQEREYISNWMWKVLCKYIYIYLILAAHFPSSIPVFSTMFLTS